jgi:hypothetical protein
LEKPTDYAGRCVTNLVLTNRGLAFLHRVALSERQAERRKEAGSTTMANAQGNGITILLGLNDYVW